MEKKRTLGEYIRLPNKGKQDRFAGGLMLVRTGVGRFKIRWIKGLSVRLKTVKLLRGKKSGKY